MRTYQITFMSGLSVIIEAESFGKAVTQACSDCGCNDPVTCRCI